MKFQEEAFFKQKNHDTNNVTIILTKKTNEQFYFNLQLELINLIVIEIGNILTFSIQTTDSKEENIISCNFKDLKPGYNQSVIKKTLKKNGNKQDDEVTGKIEYTIFKQEPKSGKNLFLTKHGWKQEKIYFSTDLKKYTPTPTNLTKQRNCKNENFKKTINANAKFCPFCGSTQNQEYKNTNNIAINKPQEIKTCSNPSCKKEIKRNAKFCPFCGTKQ